MGDNAVLALDSVKVNGRKARVFAYEDRVEVFDEEGVQQVSLTEVSRITVKGGLRKGRVSIFTAAGEQLEIRGLRVRDVGVAYRILVRLASDRNRG
jgi:hypothetical protein